MQKQIVKPAAKAAPKSAAKSKAVVKSKPTALKHFLHDFARPQRGAELAAHTQAFLELSGIANGSAYPRAKAVQVIGPTAVKYHLSNQNLAATESGLVLTDKGYAFFSARSTVDPELHGAYVDVLTRGNLNDRLGLKNPIAIGVIQ